MAAFMWLLLVALLAHALTPVSSFTPAAPVVPGGGVASAAPPGAEPATRSIPAIAQQAPLMALQSSGTEVVDERVKLETSPLVDELLQKIEDTDRGLSTTPAQREEIDAIIEKLNTMGGDDGKDWLSDPALFGNYNVAYVSAGASQRGNPAGGRYRGRLGRAFFRTESLFQHLLRPNMAVNMVTFKLMGLVPGCVTLRGKFQPQPDRPNFVRAEFDPPRISLGGRRGWTVSAGPRSSVSLAATYVDDKVRLGKGGRGSLFVFSRGGAADTPEADLWKVYTKYRPIKAHMLGTAVGIAAAVAAARGALRPAVALAVAAAFLLFNRGGIIEDSTPSPPPASESAAPVTAAVAGA